MWSPAVVVCIVSRDTNLFVYVCDYDQCGFVAVLYLLALLRCKLMMSDLVAGMSNENI